MSQVEEEQEKDRCLKWSLWPFKSDWHQISSWTEEVPPAAHSCRILPIKKLSGLSKKKNLKKSTQQRFESGPMHIHMDFCRLPEQRVPVCRKAAKTHGEGRSISCQSKINVNVSVANLNILLDTLKPLENGRYGHARHHSCYSFSH